MIALPLAALLSALAGPDSTGIASPPPVSADAPVVTAAAARGADLVSAGRTLGLEHLQADADGHRLGFENRRFRDPEQVLRRLEALGAAPATVVERRLGLATAAIERLAPGAPVPGAGSGHRFRVWHPSDRAFPGPPPGPVVEPTVGRMDLEFVPLIDYELGRLYEPYRVRIQLQSLLRVRTWPGAEAKAGIVIPIDDRFDVDSTLHPDIRRVRPAQLSLEQFAWIPRVALTSLATGYFGDNRWGVSMGAARPFDQGRWLADAQLDVHGFMAFGDGGTAFSSPSRTSGYLGLTWRPGLEIAVRARAARFLYGDEGVELQVQRSFGDFDLGFFTQQIEEVTIHGWRMAIPIPPMDRPRGRWLRVVPIERFPLSYRNLPDPIGLFLAGVPSREAYLRRLDVESLETKAQGRDAGAASVAEPTPASFGGTTGFVNTPWAGVMEDRAAEAGWNWVPRRWAYDFRERHDNHVLYATMGFLPRTEMTLRWTVFPGYRTFEEEVPDSKLTDTDEMASVRLQLLEPRIGRPGLAIGIEDMVGTRRFHSTYAVAGLPWRIQGMHGRATLGYAFVALDATRHVLDGAFGAVEWSPWDRLAIQVEHDSEKWNVGLAVKPAFGLRLRAALLDATTLSVGGGFAVTLPH